MSTTDNSTSDTSITGDAQLTSSGGTGAVGSTDALSLTDLNTLLGKDFKDIESARKAVKDTFTYVGKRKEDIAAELAQANGSSQNASASSQQTDAASKSDVQALNKRLFFSENPQYKGYEGLINRMGGDPAEVVASKEFQDVFEQGKVANEVAQRRSIVSSNPRLAETKTKMQEAVAVANATRSVQSTADILAEAINSELGAS